jgi:hypothetical protein
MGNMMIANADTLFLTISRIYQLGIHKKPTSLELSLEANERTQRVQGILKGKLTSITLVLNNLLIKEFDNRLELLKSQIEKLSFSNFEDIKQTYNELVNAIYIYFSKHNILFFLKEKICELSPGITKYSLFFDALKYFTPEELKELAVKISNMSEATTFIATLKEQVKNVRGELAINPINLLGYINQNILDEQREKLNHPYSSDKECKRIIITTTEVIFGLNSILNYLASKKISLDTLINSKITAEDVLNDECNNVNDLLSCFEIAWGLLDTLHKHKTDNPFITTSFQVAREVIPTLAANATLVIDGHGGSKFVVCGDYTRIQNEDLLNLIGGLLSADKDKNIDHLLLQSCRSGRLELNETSTINIHNKDIGKSVVAIIKAENEHNQLFETKSTSSIFVDAINNAQRSDIAFSFSENLINPCNIIGHGNLGIPAANQGETRIEWPANVTQQYIVEKNSEEERSHWKRCTIIADNSHRKFSANKFTLFTHLTNVQESASTDKASSSTPSV